MSKYIVKNPVYGCPHCNLISKSELEINDCVKRHEKDIEESLKVANLYTFLKSKTIDIFNNTLNSNLTLTCPGLSKLIKLEEAFINLAKTVGFQLSFSNFSYRNIDYENKKIKFDTVGKLIQINNFRADSFFNDSEYSISDIDLNSKYVDIKLIELVRFVKDALIKKKLYFIDLISICNIESITNQNGTSFDSLILYKYNNDNLISAEVEEYSNLLKSKERKNLKKLELYSKYRKDRFPSILISDVVFSVKNSMLQDLEKELDILSAKIDDLRSELNLRNNELLEKDSENIPIPDSSYDYDEEKLNIFIDIFSNKLK